MALSVLLLVLAVSASVAQQPTPPTIPQRFLVDLGSVTCLNVTSTACLGAAYGVIQCYHEFDDSGQFLHYREDTVFSNSSLTYNREYFNTTDQYEFFLMGDAATTLQCFHVPVQQIDFSRYFPKNYVGTQMIDDTVKADVWSGSVSVNGEPFEIYAFAWPDTGRLLGWQFGGTQYLFWHWREVDSFEPELWTPPQLTTPCFNGQASPLGRIGRMLTEQ